MVCVAVIWCMLFSVYSEYAFAELKLCYICGVLVRFMTPLGLTLSSSLLRGLCKFQFLIVLSHRKAVKINYICIEIFFTRTPFRIT